jgi:hypothetical protein
MAPYDTRGWSPTTVSAHAALPARYSPHRHDPQLRAAPGACGVDRPHRVVQRHAWMAPLAWATSLVGELQGDRARMAILGPVKG